MSGPRPTLPLDPFEQWLFGLVLLVAIGNGLLSPLTGPIYLLHALWYPDFLPREPRLLLMLASLIVSTATLAVGGVPAALAERWTGRARTDAAILWVWLAGCLAAAGLFWLLMAA